MNMNYKIALMLALATASNTRADKDTTDAFKGELITSLKSFGQTKQSIKEAQIAAASFQKVGGNHIFADQDALNTALGITDNSLKAKFASSTANKTAIDAAYTGLTNSADYKALIAGNVSAAQLQSLFGAANDSTCVASIIKFAPKTDGTSETALAGLVSALKGAINAETVGTSYHLADEVASKITEIAATIQADFTKAPSSTTITGILPVQGAAGGVTTATIDKELIRSVVEGHLFFAAKTAGAKFAALASQANDFLSHDSINTGVQLQDLLSKFNFSNDAKRVAANARLSGIANTKTAVNTYNAVVANKATLAGGAGIWVADAQSAQALLIKAISGTAGGVAPGVAGFEAVGSIDRADVAFADAPAIYNTAADLARGVNALTSADLLSVLKNGAESLTALKGTKAVTSADVATWDLAKSFLKGKAIQNFTLQALGKDIIATNASKITPYDASAATNGMFASMNTVLDNADFKSENAGDFQTILSQIETNFKNAMEQAKMSLPARLFDKNVVADAMMRANEIFNRELPKVKEKLAKKLNPSNVDAEAKFNAAKASLLTLTNKSTDADFAKFKAEYDAVSDEAKKKTIMSLMTEAVKKAYDVFVEKNAHSDKSVDVDPLKVAKNLKEFKAELAKIDIDSKIDLSVSDLNLKGRDLKMAMNTLKTRNTQIEVLEGLLGIISNPTKNKAGKVTSATLMADLKEWMSNNEAIKLSMIASTAKNKAYAEKIQDGIEDMDDDAAKKEVKAFIAKLSPKGRVLPAKGKKPAASKFGPKRIGKFAPPKMSAGRKVVKSKGKVGKTAPAA